MERINGPVPYYRFSGWDGVTQAIFTRHGGVSPAPWASLNTGGTVGDPPENVRRNHHIMYETLNVDAARAVTVWQVHGCDTVLATRPVYNRRWLAPADAIMTDRPGLPLVMRYADCTPVLAFDPVKGAIGIAHAGWRGTVLGMASHLVKAMQKAFDSRPSDLRAGIGPAIGPDRYQVGEEVVKAVHERFGTLDGLVKRDSSDGTAYFNLWEANRLDLLRAGVEDVEIMGLCTAERTDDFFSHRGEHGKTGRFGAVVCLS
ncbi:MAG: peptidoglycan editing factor PgeF [Chloroflexi bacterium]|nr:peptidoglycan editing factor PgeF [Chloroflexota bacterium]